MKLPNTVDIVNNEWQRAYEHFRMRLQERYYIDIAYYEYVLLCEGAFEKVYTDGPKSAIGWVKFKNIDILVVKSRKIPKRLKTAMILKKSIYVSRKIDFDKLNLQP